MCKEIKESSKDIRQFAKSAWEKGKIAIVDGLSDFIIKAEDYISKNGKTVIVVTIFCCMFYASGKKKGHKKAKKDLIRYFDTTEFTDGAKTYKLHVESFGSF